MPQKVKFFSRFRIHRIGFIALILSAMSAHSQLSLPLLFSDNMVLQRGQSDPVWGNASPGQTVNVKFLNHTYTTKADAKGKWMVKIPVQKEGGPYVLEVQSGNQSLQFKNVMAGEVWVCSGQSNMEMPVTGWPADNDGNFRDQVVNYKEEIAAANYPGIRLMQVTHANAAEPQTDIKAEGGMWRECSPKTVPNFSATAYFFAREVYKRTGIPIGLIHSSVGGTTAELWASRSSLKSMKEYEEDMKRLETDPDWYDKSYKVQLARWDIISDSLDSGVTNGKAVWADPKHDISAWKETDLPTVGNPTYEGQKISWYRRDVEIPQSMLEQDSVIVQFGYVNTASGIVYINGVKIGSASYWREKNVISSKLLHSGKNSVTLRILGDQGMTGPAEEMAIDAGKGGKVSLAGKWKYMGGGDLKEFSKPYLKSKEYGAGSLYNGMIAPLIPYGIRGAIWYQGEFNVGDANRYGELLPAVINGWRQKWNQGNFPFYIVQLPSIGGWDKMDGKSMWAEFRETQLRISRTVPNSAVAVTVDLPDGDLHPHNKQDFGYRLALVPLAKLYGQKNDYIGPLYKSYKIEGNSVRLFFSNTNVGLKSRNGGELKGFLVAGKDEVFHEAQARIDGQTVVVTCKDVSSPASVRYAWADGATAGNLSSKSDLPASSFRTDNWKRISPR